MVHTSPFNNRRFVAKKLMESFPDWGHRNFLLRRGGGEYLHSPLAQKLFLGRLMPLCAKISDLHPLRAGGQAVGRAPIVLPPSAAGPDCLAAGNDKMTHQPLSPPYLIFVIFCLSLYF